MTGRSSRGTASKHDNQGSSISSSSTGTLGFTSAPCIPYIYIYNIYIYSIDHHFVVLCIPKKDFLRAVSSETENPVRNTIERFRASYPRVRVRFEGEFRGLDCTPKAPRRADERRVFANQSY